MGVHFIFRCADEASLAADLLDEYGIDYEWDDFFSTNLVVSSDVQSEAERIFDDNDLPFDV